MKNLITALLLLLGSIASAQCNLNADFTYTINGSTIDFTNASTNEPAIPFYSWSYGSQFSSQENPTMNAELGWNTACLTVYDSTWTCFDSVCVDIFVDSTGGCNLNLSWNACVGGQFVTFNNTSSGTPTNASFAWLYGNQTSSQEHPTFTYDPGVTDVCFSIYDIDNPNCQDSICGPINDTCGTGCNINISWNACVGSQYVSFNNTSSGTPTNASFAWLYGNQTSSQEHPTFTYDPGATMVCFSIYDIDNPSCQDSICGPINDTCGTGCNLNISWVSSISGNNINFYSTSTGVPPNANYWWDYGTQYATIPNPTFAYDSTATVCLTIMDSTGICSDTVCGPINLDSTASVIETPNLAINVYPNPVDNELNVEVGGYGETLQLTITDLAGRVVYQGQLLGTKETIDISHLESGGYMLFVVDPEHPESRTIEKILKY